MIGIEVNGEFIELEDNASIRYEKQYQTLQDSIYQGDFSFPFNGPNSETNQRILGYLNNLEVQNKKTQFDCVIYLFGVPFKEGKLIVQKVRKNTVTFNLVAGISSLSISEKSLKDLDYGTPYFLGKYSNEIAQKATQISQEFDWEEHGFTFIPHSNKDFYGSSNTSFLGVLNMVNPLTGEIYYNTLQTGNKYALVPFLYLHFVLRAIFKAENLTPTGSFWNHPEMKKLLLFNNKALDSLNEIGETKLILNSDLNLYFNDLDAPGDIPKVPFVKGEPGTYDEPNAYSNALFEYEIKQAGLFTIEFDLTGGFWKTYMGISGRIDGNRFFMNMNTSVVPFPTKFKRYWRASLSDIGRKITIHIEWLYPVSLTGVVFKINENSTVKITHSNEDNVNLYSQYLDYKNHVKDIQVKDFLLAIKRLGVDYKFDYANRLVYIDFLTDNVDVSKAKNWTDKSIKLEERELNLEEYNQGYLISYDFGNNDKSIATSDKIVEDYQEVNTEFELPTINRAGVIFYVRNLNQYYISKHDPLRNPVYYWEKYLDNYSKYKLLNGGKEIKLGISPLSMCLDRLRVPFGTASGVGNFSVTISIPTSGYVINDIYRITFTDANVITPSTININAMGSKSLRDNTGAVISAGYVLPGTTWDVYYDGTNIRLKELSDTSKENALMPLYLGNGSSEMYGLGENDYDLRLCFLRGQNLIGSEPNNKGGLHSFANTGIYGLNGHIVGEHDFTFNLDTGFFKRYLLKPYFKTANNQLIENDYDLTEHDILTLEDAGLIIDDGLVFIHVSCTVLVSNNKKQVRSKLLLLSS
jgi:hypothetical protein